MTQSALAVIGLDEAAERSYRQLLADPGVPVGAAVRRRLVAVGLLDAAGRVAPPTVLDELIEAAADRLLAESVERQQGLARARRQVAALCAPSAAAAPDGIERIATAEAVRERLDELSFFARESIFAVQPTAPTAAARSAAERMDRRSMRRQLDLRVLCSAPTTPVAAVQVRTASGPVERLVLIDAGTAIVPDDAGGALVLTAAPLVRRLTTLFEQWWQAAGDPAPVPDAADLDLAQRLAAGGTDDQIARDLGISARQLRRRLTRLMDGCGASSRFAAGVAAGRAGWC